MAEEVDTTTNNAIVTVSELIDSAFGDPKVNVVHHKQIQTVLYLLARQLRVLERRVEVKLTPSQLAQKSSSTLSVTEVKIQTKTGTKATKGRKGKGEKRTSEEVTTGDTESTTGKNTVMRMKLDKSAIADKPSVADKISKTKETTTSSKILTEKTTKDSISSPSISQSRKLDPQDYQTLLNEVEETRERELRIIHQRADSREEHEKTPTPIASMDSVEATLEKILVVERVPVEEAAARAVRAKSGTKEQIPQISVVTQAQFQALAYIVNQLQKKFLPLGKPEFPENSELMEELRKGASLADAMAALQLSARLEATEKTLKNLLSLITNMATQIPGFEFDANVGKEIEVLFGEADKNKPEKDSKQIVKTKSAKSKTDKDQPKIVKVTSKESNASIAIPTASMAETTPDEVLYDDLRKEINEVRDNIMKQVTNLTNQNENAAETALKIARKLEQRIDKSLNLQDKMEKLECLVASYADQINSVDTGLSSQLTNYQEELTQMQHDLESGLETMAEVLANSGGDATAVTELNGHFNDLQFDIDDTMMRQNELREIQHKMSFDLEDLRIQIEKLRDIKSDRDEVADALRDKAGLSDLNGLLSYEQFEAVSGDLEARIAAAYDKFNNQEHVWQKAIEDMVGQLGEKADIVQLESLRYEFNRYLEMLRKRIKVIQDIVGEPVAAALSRKLHSDAACLSCAGAAYMKVEQTTMPELPAVRPKTVGAETQKPKGDGDGYESCYPGLPIKHPIDPRAHICNRWCGGSHTLIKPAKNRDLQNVTAIPLRKSVAQERGTDGKMYAVDKEREPCQQCIAPAPIHSSVAPEVNHEKEEIDSLGTIPYDLQPTIYNANENETPPARELYQ